MPHTPGPWTVERGINDFDIVVGNARLAGYVQKEADADVMAAAPELLAAAYAARAYDAAIEQRAMKGDVTSADHLGLPGGLAQGADLDALYADWQSKAEAAIAKAEGR